MGVTCTGAKVIDGGWGNVRICNDGDALPKHFLEPIEHYFPSSLCYDPDETTLSVWNVSGATASKGSPNITTQTRMRRRRGRGIGLYVGSTHADSDYAYKVVNVTPGETYLFEVYLCVDQTRTCRVLLRTHTADVSILYQTPIFPGFAGQDETDQRKSFVWYNPTGSGITQVRVCVQPSGGASSSAVISYLNVIRQSCANGGFGGLFTGGIADQWSADGTNTGGTAAADFTHVRAGDTAGAVIAPTGAITTGTATLTLSASYAILAGTQVRVAGAGAAGADLVTTTTTTVVGTSFTLAANAGTTVSTAAVTVYTASSQKISVGNNQKFQIKQTTNPTIDPNRLYLFRPHAYVESGDPQQVVAGVGTDLSSAGLVQTLGRAVGPVGQNPVGYDQWLPIDSYVFRPIGATWVPRVGILPGIATVAYFDDLLYIPLKDSTAPLTTIGPVMDVSTGVTLVPTVLVSDTIDRRLRRTRLVVVAQSGTTTGCTFQFGTGATVNKYSTWASTTGLSVGQEIDASLNAMDLRSGAPLLVTPSANVAGTLKVQAIAEYE